jgi:hypothetical protein
MKVTHLAYQTDDKGVLGLQRVSHTCYASGKVARGRVVLLSGDPDHGNCYLVQQLRDASGYQVRRLDDVYVEMVASRYPDFRIADLHKIVAPAYQIVMRHLTGSGTRGPDRIS